MEYVAEIIRYLLFNKTWVLKKNPYKLVKVIKENIHNFLQRN